ncbi:hypothetical protein BDW69DRAFT_117947 [Aspergillus filifer]
MRLSCALSPSLSSILHAQPDEYDSMLFSASASDGVGRPALLVDRKGCRDAPVVQPETQPEILVNEEENQDQSSVSCRSNVLGCSSSFSSSFYILRCLRSFFCGGRLRIPPQEEAGVLAFLFVVACVDPEHLLHSTLRRVAYIIHSSLWLGSWSAARLLGREYVC